MPVWRDPERDQYGYADHTFRHPHFQVEAIQVNDRVDLLARARFCHYRMELLGPGEANPQPATSKPNPPSVSREDVPPAADRQLPPPEPARPSPPPPATSVVTRGQFGVLRLRVQPAAGEIRIDSEPWGTLGGMGEISIHLPAGIHRIELHRAGTSVFATDVEIRRGETTPLNIRLAI